MNRIDKDQRITEVWMLVNRKRLAKLMAIQDVSHRDLARMIGWKSHSYVGRILRGEIKSVDPDAAARIACVFGVGVDDLFLPKASSLTVRDDHRRGAA